MNLIYNFDSFKFWIIISLVSICYQKTYLSIYQCIYKLHIGATVREKSLIYLCYSQYCHLSVDVFVKIRIRNLLKRSLWNETSTSELETFSTYQSPRHLHPNYHSSAQNLSNISPSIHAHRRPIHPIIPFREPERGKYISE